MEKLVLIDGNSLINRAYFATPHMNTKDGIPTNAVYSFINMLIRMSGDLKPTHLAVAFDLKGPTFRHKLSADYKATRKPSPDDLAVQFPILKKLLLAMDIACFEKEGYEADDIIGAIAKQSGMQTVIVTGDRDALQLIDDKISVCFTKRGITQTQDYNIENFKEMTGILPKNIVDLKAIMGDASDNICGVPGIGEKGAMTLIQAYGSVENIYNSLDLMSAAVRKKLEEGKDCAFLSYKLAEIDTKFEIDFEKKQLEYNFPFDEKIREEFKALGFNSFAKRDIFKQKDFAPAAVQTVSNITVNSASELDIQNEFAYYDNGDIYIYSGGKAQKIKVKDNFFDEGADQTEVYMSLKRYFENENNIVYLFNYKNCRHKLSQFDIDIKCSVHDISIKKYLADFTGRDETLEEMQEEYGVLSGNSAYDLFKIDQILQKQLAEHNMSDLYAKIELPLSEVLYSMEKNGFKIDAPALLKLKEKYENEIKELSELIYFQSGEIFNINSPKQLAVVLFEKLGLKKGRKTKTGYSTNVDVLEKLKDEHPVIQSVLTFRRKQKLLSTYIEGFLPLIDKSTGLVHTSFNQLVTTTGRLSSKEPNLQNIPIRDDEGREIRRFFVPRSQDRVLVGADYSQIELRLLAAFSGCTKLIEAFKRGDDIHSITASEVFGVARGQVDENMRRSAKAVNFGIIYGISDFGLSQNLNISRKQAAEYIERYFKMYPEVKIYMQKNVDFAKKNGYITTLAGRRRTIREINSPNYTVRSFGERAAMNMPLQGSSADIVKIAMVNVYERMKRENLRSELILQVHDELIIDAYESEREIAGEILKEEMQNAVALDVPLTVEVSFGHNWEDMK